MQTQDNSGILSGLNKTNLLIGVLAGGGIVTFWYFYKKCVKTTCFCSINKQLYQDIIDNNTLIAKHYLPELHIKLRDKETSNNYSVKDLVKDCVGRFKAKGQGTAPGIVIGDEECYRVFREIIDPVLKDLHGVDVLKRYQYVRFKDSDWRKIKGKRFVDKKVLSCVLSTSRNLAGCPFPCALSDEERVVVASRLVHVLNSLPVHLRGAYTRLCNLTRRRQIKLGLLEDYGLTSIMVPLTLQRVPEICPLVILDNLALFESSNTPDGRILWWTENRQCKVFINFLDHIKFVISNPKRDLQQALRDYMELVSQVEHSLREQQSREFAWNSDYGYLTSHLMDVGTGLHVEVKVRFKMIHKTMFFKRLTITKQITCSPSVHGRNSDTFVISNSHLIETNEVDIIQHVIDCVNLLLEIDKRLSRGEEFRDLMP